MSICIFTSDQPDYAVAYQIRKGLEDGPLTLFRQQLVDVIKANSAELFGVEEEDPDE